MEMIKPIIEKIVSKNMSYEEQKDLLSDEIVILKAGAQKWPTTTDKLAGDELLEYEETIKAANELVDCYMYFHYAMMFFALIFALISLIVILPLSIILSTMLRSKTNKIFEERSKLIKLEMKYGICSDYIVLKRISIV